MNSAPNGTPRGDSTAHDAEGEHHGRCALAARALVVGVVALLLLAATDVYLVDDAGANPACEYSGDSDPPRNSPQSWALQLNSMGDTEVGATWLPIRLAVRATPARFDAYAAQIQSALCNGTAPRFDVTVEDLQCVEILLVRLHRAVAELEEKRVRNGLLVFRDIEGAPRKVREAFKGLFDSGGLLGEAIVSGRSPIRLIVLLRVPPEVDPLALYNARVAHLMEHLDLSSTPFL